MTPRPRVIIVGAGFGGLYCARALRGAPVDLAVLDRRNHHLFQPLLYQVATAGLSAPDIARPIRRILRGQANARVLMADVKGVDLAARRVFLDCGDLDYDYLVLAPGAVDHYFGHDEWREHAIGLKSLRDALEMRNRMLRAFESAETAATDAERTACLTFVIVGGGPTGVELAGAIAEIARRTLTRDFRSFDPKATRVVLVEGGERVLQSYPPALSEKARRQLEKLHVQVRTGTQVTGIDALGVALGEERIESRCVIWAAGVRGSPLTARLGVALDKGGRVEVGPDLSLPERRNAFVIGDAAAVTRDGKPVPGVAPAAIQMGRHAAAQIRADLAGTPRTAFAYRDKGSLATIGRSAAVADLGRLRLSGFPAWLLWIVIHIATLVGFRNRVFVMLEWAFAWFTYQRSARVILSDDADAD